MALGRSACQIALLGVALLVGCGPAETQPATATTAPATRPTAVGQAAEPALPAQALLGLDDLPPIDPPQRTPAETPTAEAAQDLLASGREHFQAQRFSQAVADLDRAVAFDPTSAEIRRLLGLSHIGLGNAARAREHLTIVAETAGDDAQAQLLLGRLDGLAGRSDLAVTRFRSALACSDLESDSAIEAEAIFRLGEALRELGYLTASYQAHQRFAALVDEHGEQYLRSTTLRPLVLRPELSMARRGELLLRLGRAEEAADILDQAYRQNRTFDQARELLAEALLAKEDYDAVEALILEWLADPTLNDQAVDLARRLYTTTREAEGPGRLLTAHRAARGTPPAEVTLAMARLTYDLGSSDQAAELLREFTPGRGEDTPVVLMQLARWKFESGQVESALVQLAEALAEQPELAPEVTATIEQAGAGAFGDDLDRRFGARARADESPAKSALHFVAGAVAIQTGKLHLAEEQLDRAIRADGGFGPAYEMLAEVLLRQDRVVQTRALAERIDQPELQYLRDYLLGRASLAEQDYPAAGGAFVRALAAQPEHLASSLGWAEATMLQGRFNEAARQLGDIIERTQDPRAYEMLVGLLVGMNRTDEAIERVDQLLAREPENPTGLRLRATLLLSAGRLAEAREAMEPLLAARGDEADVMLLKVRSMTAAARMGRAGLLGRRRYDAALGLLREVLADRPNDLDALRLMGELMLLRQRYDEAADVLARVQNADPNDQQIGLLHVHALNEAGRTGEAVAALEPYAEQWESVPMRTLYVDLLAEAGMYDRAAELLDGWADQETHLTRAEYEVRGALLLAERGRVDQSLERLDELFSRAVDGSVREVIRRGRLRALAEGERWQALSSEADAWLTDSGPTLSPSLLVGQMLIDGEQYDLVEQTLLRHRQQMLEAAEAAGDDAATEAEMYREHAAMLGPVLVESLASENQYEQAQRIYQQLIEQEPNNRTLLLSSQYVYRGRDREQVQIVINALSRALELEGTSGVRINEAQMANLRNNLGYLMADHGLRLDEAEQLIRQSDAIEPGEANVQDSLAWVFYKQGRFDEARDYILRSLNDIEGEHAVIFDHAGDIFWRLGQRERAIEMWTEALDLAEAAEMIRGESLDEDTARVLDEARSKINAVERGETPATAPLGEGVELPQL